MKKCGCFLFALVLLCSTSFFSLPAAFAEQTADIAPTQLAESDTCYAYNAQTKTLTVSGSGAMPDMKNSADSQPWYDWRSDGSIEHVIVEEGVTAIGNFCFYSVKANDFTIPASVQRIGRSAFASSGITSVTLPFGITELESNVFDGCDQLTDVVLPDTLTCVGAYAFRLCLSLTQIHIPYSVTEIGSYAFDRCSVLQTVVFDSQTADVNLMNYAFYDCAALRDVTLPVSASFGRKVIGVGRSGALNGVTVKVYDGSAAHIYALTNTLNFTLTDGTYPLTCGVAQNVVFEEDTVDTLYDFTFLAPFDGAFNFYSEGDCDLAAVLLNGTATVAENDDVDENDRNFALTATLTAGETYTLRVRSMKSQGSATVMAYPDEILSLDVKGNLHFAAEDGFHSGARPLFPITDSQLENFVLTVHFAGDFSDMMYYRRGTFNRRALCYENTQITLPFTCGDNTAHLRLGDVYGDFTVQIEHTYQGTVVPYTVDEDGYTIYTCMLCGDSYTGDYVESPAFTVSGRCYLMTTPEGEYDYLYPLSGVTVDFNGKTYAADDDGRFSFRTLEGGTLTVHQPYAPDRTFTVENNHRDVNFGAVPMAAYDFNRDGYVNGRDLAYFKIHLQKTLGKGYFMSAVNFM